MGVFTLCRATPVDVRDPAKNEKRGAIWFSLPAPVEIEENSLHIKYACMKRPLLPEVVPTSIMLVAADVEACRIPAAAARTLLHLLRTTPAYHFQLGIAKTRPQSDDISS